MNNKGKIDMVISVKNLSKVYKLYDKKIDRLKESIHPRGKIFHRDFYALNNVSFEVKRGEVLGIIGKNGSGKSTLLSIIGGILAPSSGEVKTRGHISALLGLEAGFNPELTGMENIYFNGAIQGYSKQAMDERIKDIISFADIGDFIHQPIKIYSSGMKARLSFAVAININPDILIVDEVLSVGDILFRRKCYAKMQDFMEQGKTILFVTHSVNIINELCSRAIFLDKGELILEGPSVFVTRNYQNYLFSKAEQKEAVLNEIRELNNNSEKKEKFLKQFDEKENQYKSEFDNDAETFIDSDKKKSKSLAFLLPNFKPQSTTVQKFFDVEILDPHIKTLSGEDVNVLEMNGYYIFSFKVKFNLNFDRVYFSFLIQNEKGYSVSGVMIPAEKVDNILNVKKGDLYLIRFKYKCSLLPGIYYISASVLHINKDKKKIPLIRINDISVFKIQRQKKLNFWGVLHLQQEGEILKIEK